MGLANFSQTIILSRNNKTVIIEKEACNINIEWTKEDLGVAFSQFQTTLGTLWNACNASHQNAIICSFWN